jgi:hypothetical protein
MLKRATPWYKRALVIGLLVTQFATFLPMANVAEALTTVKDINVEPVEEENPGGGLSEIRDVASVKTRYGLVPILVTEEVWDARSSRFRLMRWIFNLHCPGPRP